MKADEITLKKLKMIEKVLKGGYDDTIPDSSAEEIASASIGRQEKAYEDMVALSNEMKNKIREIADMNTMGNVKLGLGEAWYQGQGHDDDHIPCPHCGGKLLINKLKKKLYKRKVRRNEAKGKGVPKPPKFMRSKEEVKKKRGPKKGGKSEKASDWMKYCKAVAKTPKMQGKPWNEVMKKASKLKKKGVSYSDLQALA